MAGGGGRWHCGGVDALHTHARNAVAKWRSLGPEHCRLLEAPPGTAALWLPRLDRTRVIVTDDGAPPRPARELVTRLPGGTVIVEDTFDRLRLPVDAATTVYRVPVMERPPAPPMVPRMPRGMRVVAVEDVADLERAERVIVEGFPHPSLRPHLPGALLPPEVLDRDGWRVWLALHGATPVGAGSTFDDGAVLGVYQMATLPAWRGRGVARAVLTTALASRPQRPATLVATDAGRPLYASMGFRPLSTAVWYVWPG